MAASKNELQIQWSAANSVSLSSSELQTSDTVTFSSDTVWADLILKADNNATPASGDTVTFEVLLSGGDPDGAVTDEFTTAGHSMSFEVDTNTEDPAILHVRIPAPKSMQLNATNNATSNGITVSALVYEQKV